MLCVVCALCMLCVVCLVFSVYHLIQTSAWLITTQHHPVSPQTNSNSPTCTRCTPSICGLITVITYYMLVYKTCVCLSIDLDSAYGRSAWGSQPGPEPQGKNIKHQYLYLQPTTRLHCHVIHVDSLPLYTVCTP